MRKKKHTHPAEFESVALEELHKLPGVPGVYFAMQEDEILYVGQSRNIWKRWQRHHKHSELLEFDGVRIHWINSDGRPLLKQEAEWIKICQPALNFKKVIYAERRKREIVAHVPMFVPYLLIGASFLYCIPIALDVFWKKAGAEVFIFISILSAMCFLCGITSLVTAFLIQKEVSSQVDEQEREV